MPAIDRNANPLNPAPASGDHSAAPASDGHSGALRPPSAESAASSPDTNSPAAIAASQGGSGPATRARGAVRAYQAPMPEVSPNSMAASRPPTPEPIASI